MGCWTTTRVASRSTDARSKQTVAGRWDTCSGDDTARRTTAGLREMPHPCTHTHMHIQVRARIIHIIIHIIIIHIKRCNTDQYCTPNSCFTIGYPQVHIYQGTKAHVFTCIPRPMMLNWSHLFEDFGRGRGRQHYRRALFCRHAVRQGIPADDATAEAHGVHPHRPARWRIRLPLRHAEFVQMVVAMAAVVALVVALVVVALVAAVAAVVVLAER